MKREVKSFVLRAGRMSERQRMGFAEQLPLVELTMDAPWDYRSIFMRDAPTVLEIGFGMGASLLETAKAAPDWNFIGIEVHRPGLGRLASDLVEHQLTNVRLVCADATEALHKTVQPGGLAGVQLFFPDPWPKKRHHKRRLVQPAFVTWVAEALMPGGFFHCATDWADYADHIQRVMADSPRFSLSSESDLKPISLKRPLTKFEKRGIKFGHNVFDMVYKKII